MHPSTLAAPIAALSLTLTLTFSGTARAAPSSDLLLHGTRLPPSCRADAWPSAQAAVEQAAGRRDAAQLVTLLRTHLCADEAAARASARQHATRRIVQRSEGTGEPPSRRRVDAAQALVPPVGQVFGLQVQRAGSARVVALWQADEACVHSVTLAHRPGGWMFDEAGSACD